MIRKKQKPELTGNTIKRRRRRSVGFSLIADSVPVVLNTAEDFGALTLINDGDLQLSATGSPTSWAIVGGTASTQYQIDNSGIVTAQVGAPTGGTIDVTATNSTGTSPTKVITITSLANTYSAGEDNLDAIIAVGAAVSGKTVLGRPGAEIGGTVAGDTVVITVDYVATVTITSEDPLIPATIRRIQFNTGGNVLFEDITISDNFRDTIDVSDNTGLITMTSTCGFVSYNRADISSVPVTGQYLKGIRADSGSTMTDLLINNCIIHDISRLGPPQVFNQLIMNDNEFFNILVDGITQTQIGTETADWEFKRNKFGKFFDSGAHSDCVQIFTDNMTQDRTTRVFIWDNWIDPSENLGLFPNGVQFIFISGATSFTFQVDIRGNAYLGDMGQFIGVNNGAGFVGFNTGIQGLDSGGTPIGNKAQLTSSGTWAAAYNCTNGKTLAGPILIGHIDISTVNQTNYEAAFTGTEFDSDATDSRVVCTPKVSGTLDTSPIQTGFDWYTTGDEPPILWNIAYSNVLATTIDVGVETSIANGTLSGVATQSSDAPSAAQIIAGQDEFGAAADWAGSITVTTLGVQSLSSTGLVADTAYFFYTTQVSSSFTGNVSEGGTVTTAAGFTANAVDFDGSTGVALTTGFTGGGNSKQGVFSLWFYNDNATWQGTGNIYEFATSSGTFVDRLNLASSGRMVWTVRTSVPATIFTITTSNDALGNQTWQHVTGWFDTTSGVTTAEIFVDGVSVGTATPTTDALIGTIGRGGVGSNSSGGSSFLHNGGQLSEVWVETTETLDMGVSTNQDKFRLAGKPVSLGADGSTPTGNQPEVYLTNPTATWQTNQGGAGGFTEFGTLTTAGTSPSD